MAGIDLTKKSVGRLIPEVPNRKNSDVTDNMEQGESVMRRIGSVVCCLGFILSAVNAPARAEDFNWNETSRRINDNWDKIKTPEKIRSTNPIRSTKPLQKVTGEWKIPGAIQVPGGINIIKQDDCQKRLLISSDTLFEFDQSKLTPQAEKSLAQAGEEIKKSGSHPTIVEGHTDAIGNDLYNQTLSEKRAKTVKEWLVKHGYINALGKVIGYGKQRPVARNTTPDGNDYPEGRRLNRRVEIVIDTCAKFAE